VILWRTYKLKHEIFNMRFKKEAEYALNAVIREARRMESGTVSVDTNA